MVTWSGAPGLGIFIKTANANVVGVTTNAASSITSTSATLNGTVGTSPVDNTSFWWGTSSAGPFTPAVDPGSQLGDWSHDAGLGSKSASETFSYPLTGLTPSTLYHFVAWVQVGGTWYPDSVVDFTTNSPTPVYITTNSADSITTTDATLNGTNGNSAAAGHSFWVSLSSPIDTSSSTIPAGVYSTPDFGSIAANAPFSASLSSITTTGVPTNLPAITPSTPYYFVAWSNIGGTWYHGSEQIFSTATPAPTPTPILTLTANPTSATISQSTLVPETSGVPTGGNATVDTATSGLTPIQVTLTNTGTAASANVRISPIGADPHIQLWAKDTSDNWYDINVTGWMDSAGISIPTPFTATTDIYAISDVAGPYPLTVNLVLVSDSSVVATTGGTITVSAPVPADTTAPTVPTLISPADGTFLDTNNFDFDWNDSTDDSSITYIYQASQNPTQSEGVLTTGLWTSGTLPTSTIHSSGAGDGTWYWQVKAVDASNNESAWSPIWNVTLDTVAPDAPTLIAPLNDAVVKGIPSLTNSWNSVSGAVKYKYESYNDSAMTSPRWSGEFTTTSKTANNVAETTFWWRVKAVDAAGNESGWSNLWKVTIDNTAPTVSLVDADGATYNLATPSPKEIKITFSEDLSNTPTIEVHTTVVGYYVGDCSDGDAKTFCFDYPINSGEELTHTIYISGAADLAGNIMTQDSTHTFNVDTIAPSGGSISYENGYVNSTSQTINYIIGSDAGFGLNFATGKIQRRVGNTNGADCESWGPWQDLIFETDGSYIDSDLVDEKCYRYSYIIEDNAGNSTTYGPNGTLKVDTSTPVSTDDYDGLWHNSGFAVNISTNSGIGSKTRLLACYALESDPNCSPLSPLTGFVFGSNSSSITISGDDGSYRLRYRTRDEAGNIESPIHEIIVKIDSTLPTVTNVNVVEKDTWNDYSPYIKGDSAFRVRADVSDIGSGLNVATCEYSLDNGATPWIAGSFNSATNRCIADISPTISDGTTYMVNVRVTDKAGNTGTGTAVSYTVDSANPSTTSTTISPDTGTYTNTNPTITGTITDSASPIVSCQYRYRVTGSTWPTFANGAWDGTNCTVTISGLTDGVSYDFSMRGLDSVGNYGGGAQNNITRIVDVTAPTIDLVFPAIGPGATSFQAIFSEDVNATNAGNPAKYFLNNWPDAGGTGDLSGQATVLYDSTSHTATITFTNPGWYVSPEQEWGVQGIYDLAENLQNVNPYAEYSTPMTAPVTTDDIADSNWHNSVTVNLSCADIDGSGCKTTYYTTDGTEPDTSSSSGNSFTLNTDGEYTIKYFSVDNAGNIESIKTAVNQVKIDTITPTLSSAETKDLDNDGKIDTIKLTFNESIGDYALAPGTADGWDVAGYGGESIGTGVTENDNILMLSVTEGSVVDTQATPAVTYTYQLITNSTHDTAGNQLETMTLTATDGVAPIMVSARTTSPTTIDVTFSEDLQGDELTVGDFEVNNGNGPRTPASVSENNGVVTLTLNDSDSMTAGSTPTITINPNDPNSIVDLAGNEQVNTDSVVATDGIPLPLRRSGGSYIIPLGQVLGASTGPIPGCGNRTTGFSITTGHSCIGNTGEGQVLGDEKFMFLKNMKLGSRLNPDVMELQKFLNTAGYGPLVTDGKFGRGTKSAVIKFQLANGLRGDGSVGALTRAVLNK